MLRINMEIAMQTRGRWVRADDADGRHCWRRLPHEHENGQDEILMMMLIMVVVVMQLMQQVLWWWLQRKTDPTVVAMPVILVRRAWTTLRAPRSCRGYPKPSTLNTKTLHLQIQSPAI